jgi:tRNA dimethylallyltransferase
VDVLVAQGLFQEVEELLDRGLMESDISMKGIGYKEIIGFFDGAYTREEAVELIKKNTRHLAKRQLTWFRRYEEMQWFNLSEYDKDEDGIRDILKWLKEKEINQEK